MTFDKNKSNMAKCIAVVLMLCHHLFGFYPEQLRKYEVYSVFFNLENIMKISYHGKVCVGIFVCITAFGIDRSYNAQKISSKHDIECFCIKRYVKLTLNFLIVFLIALSTSFFRENGLQDVYFLNGIKISPIYVLLDMLGLAYYFNTPSMNPTWWYMSLAILYVFIIPMFIWLYKKIGMSLLCICIFPAYLSLNGTFFYDYLFCMILGIFCAEEYIIERIASPPPGMQNRIQHLQICMLKVLVCLFVLIGLYIGRIVFYKPYYIDALIALAISVFCMMLGELLPFIEKVMGYIGKHSMNIFLIHTLIYKYYFMDFIYGFQNWFLILMALLIASLLTSIVIEWLKKLLKINLLSEKISKYLCNVFISNKEKIL